MRKQLPIARQYGVEEHQPRCFWGMLHVLDYHHWNYVKRLLHIKKHHLRRRRIRCCATPNTISFTHDTGNAPERVDGEAEHLLGQHQIEEGKALVAEDISKKDTGKMLALLRKARHDHPVDGEISRANQCSTKVEDELLQRIICDRNFGTVKGFTGEHDGIGKPSLMKARSFPLPDSSRARHYRVSTLKHKQGEVWFPPRGDSPKVDTINFPRDHKMSQVPFNATLKHGTTVSSLDSSQTLSNHGWNHLIISQFKCIKQRIKRALKDSTKECLPPEVVVDHGSSAAVKEVSNDLVEESKSQRMTRLSSLNESLDKYARLFGESFSSESKSSKLNNSKSLKLTAEDRTDTPKTFRRRLSLPDHETLSSILIDLSYDNLYLVSAKTKPESNKSKELELNNEPLHDFQKIDSLEKSSEESVPNLIIEPGPGLVGGGNKDLYADGDIFDENSVEFLRREHVNFQREETAATSKSTTNAELSSPAPFLHTLLPHDETKPEAHCPSEGPCSASSNENLPARNETADNLSRPRIPMVKEDVCDFNFIKDILRLGGFFENEFIESWESMDLPLNPEIFDEFEASKLHGHECSDSFCVHLLLFDLINEALLDIHDTQFTYFPRPFSFSQSVRPVTKGQHLLEEVWTRVKWYRGPGPQLSLTLDDIVGRDIASGDRWMDLKWESEALALELEDIIMDELIDELTHSLLV